MGFSFRAPYELRSICASRGSWYWTCSRVTFAAKVSHITSLVPHVKRSKHWSMAYGCYRMLYMSISIIQAFLCTTVVTIQPPSISVWPQLPAHVLQEALLHLDELLQLQHVGRHLSKASCTGPLGYPSTSWVAPWPEFVNWNVSRRVVASATDQSGTRTRRTPLICCQTIPLFGHLRMPQDGMRSRWPR